MPAFGSSTSLKDAESRLNELHAWFWDMAKQQYGLSDEALTNLLSSAGGQDQLLKQIAEDGVGTIGDAQQSGYDIMPGVDEEGAAAADRTATLKKARQDFVTKYGVEPTTDQLNK